MTYCPVCEKSHNFQLRCSFIAIVGIVVMIAAIPFLLLAALVHKRNQ